MALRINYNLAASVAQRSLGLSQDSHAKQAESGLPPGCASTRPVMTPPAWRPQGAFRTRCEA
jgi:hypothetical protein